MSTTTTATASIEVAVDPETAFAVFTDDIGTWWKRGTPYWNDAERGQELRFEPRAGGRLHEVHDPRSGAGFEIGRVVAWEPGRRLAFTWRQADWATDETTDVDIRFEPVGQGTRVTVEHSGWDRVRSATAGSADGHGRGWTELLDFYATSAAAR
ncbi:SRPBCC domain-containing protein [Micromonospora sp. DT31]|uniref:SRPBCC domain-containing protein n=1 Tax=Micromonospora sp. DT31 TaxID=3393434 RepID=UPI003CF736B2